MKITLTILFSSIISIYDADTFRINLPCDFPLVCQSVPIRAAGFDSPEISGKCHEEKALAKLARDYLRFTLKQAKVIELRDLQRDKYFRLRADVYVDGVPLKDTIINRGLARPYSGGKRQSWCIDAKIPNLSPQQN